MTSFVFFNVNYFTWHYSKGVGDVFSLWKNLLWGISNFFSVLDLLKSLFSPWKQLGEEKTGTSFDPARSIGNAIVNIIMRIVGFIIRILVIVAWLVVWTIAFISGPILLLLWVVLPVLGIGLFVTGIALIFTK